MKCQRCLRDDQRSKIFIGESTTATLSCGEAFYDEDGNYHSHTGPSTTTQYRCSRGHQWKETRSPACAACDALATPRMLLETRTRLETTPCAVDPNAYGTTTTNAYSTFTMTPTRTTLPEGTQAPAITDPLGNLFGYPDEQ